MFSQATREIYNMKAEMASIDSRVGQCENSIYHIKHDAYDDSSIWCKISEAESKTFDNTLLISDLRADVESLRSCLEDLVASISQLKAVLEPEADASTENPKEKADLEIFEPNIDNDMKHYVDLDLITEPRYKIGVFDDDNWYNLQ